VLRDIVEAAITAHLDPHELDVLATVEHEERALLQSMADAWGRS
jgi:hypothetical protein